MIGTRRRALRAGLILGAILVPSCATALAAQLATFTAGIPSEAYPTGIASHGGAAFFAEPGADEVGQRNLMLQAQGQGDGVRLRQAGTAAAVLAPVDEHLAEAPVVALVGGDPESLGVDGDRGGVSAATS